MEWNKEKKEKQVRKKEGMEGSCTWTQILLKKNRGAIQEAKIRAYITEMCSTESSLYISR